MNKFEQLNSAVYNIKTAWAALVVKAEAACERLEAEQAAGLEPRARRDRLASAYKASGLGAVMTILGAEKKLAEKLAAMRELIPLLKEAGEVEVGRVAHDGGDHRLRRLVRELGEVRAAIREAKGRGDSIAELVERGLPLARELEDEQVMQELLDELGETGRDQRESR